MTLQEIDLVPQDFRRWQRMRKHLRIFLFIFSGLLLAVISGKVMLARTLSKETMQLMQLEAEEKAILAQRAKIDALNNRISLIQARIEALEILRGGPPVEKIFLLLSQAINEDVWLTQVTFIRAGDTLKASKEKTSAGYFVVEPARSGKDGDASASWREQTHLEIHGEALNHSNLAEFTKNLLQSPEVENVHILDTKTKNYAFGQTVEYNLAVVLRARKS